MSGMCKSANKKQECPRIEENGQFFEIEKVLSL